MDKGTQKSNNQQVEKEKLLNFFNNLTINDKSTIEPIEPIITIDSSNFAIKAGVSVLNGKKGSGKSTVLRVMITLALMNEKPGWFDDLTIYVKPAKEKPVIYINTEMPDSLVKDMHDQILKDLGVTETPKNFKVLDFLGLDIERRQSAISDLFKVYDDIHLIFIDGGADTLEGVNDETSSIKAVETLIKLAQTYQTSIVNVIHLNQGNGETRGHYGQQSERKASGIATVKFDESKEVFEIKYGGKSRGTKMFKPIHFNYIDKNRVQRISPDTTATIVKKAKEDSLLQLVHTCFKDRKRIKRDELTKLISSITSTSIKTGQNKFNQMLERNLVTIDEQKYAVCLTPIPENSQQLSLEV